MVFLCLALYAAFFLVVQHATLAMTVWRCRFSATLRRRPVALPPISLVRPLCGVESHTDATLAANYGLTYPDYEVIFCVARADDPVVAHVEAVMAAHPDRSSRLLIGDDRISTNPKLNNMVKGWGAARHDRIAFVDSNVLMPPDFLQTLIAAWRDDTGVVSAPPMGTRPDGLWAHVECAFLNSYEARWQYAADTVGLGFAQGKTLMFRRCQFPADGVAVLAAEPAEDAAATKYIRGIGLRARLAGPSPQPLGRRGAREVWARQLRWARLRRATFALEFAPEIFTGAALPVVAICAAALGCGWPLGAVAPAFLAAWFLPELGAAWLCGWPVGPLALPAFILRDALLTILYVGAWTGKDFTWRGTEMSATSNVAAEA
jgi:ceramide glucosyltransferase